MRKINRRGLRRVPIALSAEADSKQKDPVVIGFMVLLTIAALATVQGVAA